MLVKCALASTNLYSSNGGTAGRTRIQPTGVAEIKHPLVYDQRVFCFFGKRHSRSSMLQYVVKQLEHFYEHYEEQNGDPIRMSVIWFSIFHARFKRRAFAKPAIFEKKMKTLDA